ncbi:MAG: hypothetical protein RIQ89_497 [Bacteroidota bacterium]|jgi:carbon monoxide dehydrogenase subunit G
MTRIESKTQPLPFGIEKVFAFLNDCNNLQLLMPPEVSNWQSTASQCSFTIKGMATLGMKIAETTPPSQVKILREGKGPFDFILYCNLSDSGDQKSVIQLIFDADLNPMLKMMAVKPLTNFLNILTENLSKQNL